MYNNEVTYNEELANTKEADLYYDKLEKYLARSGCSSHCPKTWAKEVYYFLKDLDDTFGLSYSEDTIRGYFVQGNGVYDRFIKFPLEALFKKEKVLPHMLRYMPKTKMGWFRRRLSSFKASIQYAFRAEFHRTRARLMNKITKPRIQFSQFKEKYGGVNFYYSADPAIEAYVEDKILELKVKLSLKGVYYEMSSLWDNYRSWTSPDYSGEPIIDYDGKPSFRVKEYAFRKKAKSMLTKEEVEFIEAKVAAIPTGDKP